MERARAAHDPARLAELLRAVLEKGEPQPPQTATDGQTTPVSRRLLPELERRLGIVEPPTARES